jgi:hypothetical protein
MTALFHSGQPILLGFVGLYALYTAVRDTRSGVARGRWTSWSMATRTRAYYTAMTVKYLVSAIFLTASLVELSIRAP